MTAMTKKEEPPKRWRENIEALLMAIVVALLFKYFILEISKIPSGSMQPTLMGSPETGVFDRVLVDKLSYHLRDPERFEIVVFKHPLERSRVMVKRLVGMPGEELKIEHGDLWVRPDDSAPWEHLRRPADVMDMHWRRIDRPNPPRPDWNLVRGEGWRVEGDAVVAAGEGLVRFREQNGPIRNAYLDGYPDSMASALARYYGGPGNQPVGDLRLDGEVEVGASTRAFFVELTEGSSVYRFELSGPGAGDAPTRIRARRAGTEEREAEAADVRLAAGERVSFSVRNLDDRLSLRVDGEEVLSLDIPISPDQSGYVSLGFVGGGGSAEGLAVYRDLFYLTPPGRKVWSAKLDEGSYVMLGDNTQDSADSRLWRAITKRVPFDGEEVLRRGNYRENGENPSFGELDGDPWLAFRDEWGERRWYPRAEVGDETFPGNQPLVPRELIQGRALAVFWPLRPVEGLWRLGWLH